MVGRRWLLQVQEVCCEGGADQLLKTEWRSPSSYLLRVRTASPSGFDHHVSFVHVSGLHIVNGIGQLEICQAQIHALLRSFRSHSLWPHLSCAFQSRSWTEHDRFFRTPWVCRGAFAVDVTCTTFGGFCTVMY